MFQGVIASRTAEYSKSVAQSDRLIGNLGIRRVQGRAKGTFRKDESTGFGSEVVARKLGSVSYLISEGVGVIKRTPVPWREVSVNRVPSLRSQIATSPFDSLETPSWSVRT
jgi:hypothetical protein